MNTKTAVLGTTFGESEGTERDLLRAAAVQSLRQQAGYVPEQGVFTDTGAVQKQGELILLPELPSGVEFHAEKLAKFCAGYGWVAGSAALNCLLEKQGLNPQWTANDFDVFCHTENAYQQLRNTVESSRITDENERGVKVSDYGIIVDGRRYWLTDVNFIKPLPADNWLYPQNVLAQFDLTCCTVAIIQPGVALALYPHDVTNRIIDYTGRMHSPVTTLRRVFKYMKRGFKPHVGLWSTMAADERLLPVMGIFDEMRQALGNEQILDVVRSIYAAIPSGVTYSSYVQQLRR